MNNTRSSFHSQSLLKIIQFLLLIICSHGARDDAVLRLNTMDDDTHHHDHESNNHHDAMTIHDHTHTSHTFFLLETLKSGHKLYTSFPENPQSARILQRQEAESIPFSSKDLPSLLARFGFAERSPEARAMRRTLAECEAEPIRTETKLCATSLESMLDFVGSTFGPTSPRFGAISTARSGSGSGVRRRNYTVAGVAEVAAARMVGCHTTPYPYLVFYCHSSVTEVRVFEVGLVGDGGDDVEAVAVCHMDTSEWSAGHVSFRELGIERGTVPVCHFFPVGHLVWVPKLG